MEQLLVIKIGGNVIDNAPALESFLKKFATIDIKHQVSISATDAEAWFWRD